MQTLSEPKYEDSMWKTIYAVATGVLKTLFEGYILMCMWAWFVAPVFAAPQIDYMHAIGLTMFISFVVSMPIASFAYEFAEIKALLKNETAWTNLSQGTCGIITGGIAYPIVFIEAAIWHHFIH